MQRSYSLGQNGDAGSAYTQHFEATRRLYAAEAELERIQREADDAHTCLIDLGAYMRSKSRIHACVQRL